MAQLATLGLNRIVNIQVLLSPQAPQAEDVDTCLILGSSNVIDVEERMREYGSISAVATDFGESAPEFLAAVPWFAQLPQPQTLNIGRWAKTATNAQLIGASLSAAEQLLTNFTAITAPGFYAVLSGVPFNVTPASFATAGNLPGVAGIVQTALAGDVAGSAFVWNNSFDYFQMSVGGTAGVTSTTSFLAPPTGLGSFTFAGQPVNLDTITIGGTVVEFVTGTPTGNEVQIGASLPATLTALQVFLEQSTDVNLVKCTYIVAGSVLYVTAAVSGAPGDSITISKSSTEITVSGATLTGGAATDVSGLLGMTAASSGAYAAQGVAAESALQAVVTLDTQFANQWYGLVTLGVSDADVLAIAAYVEADAVKHFYGVTTPEAGVLVPTDTTDIAFLLSTGTGFNHTGVQFSSSSPYAMVSALARILTTAWGGSNTTITLKFKQEPGIVPEALNATQANALEAKNCNVFVSYDDGTSIFEQGVCSSGQFIDTVIGLDWLAIQLQNDLYTFLFESGTKVPETDPGNHELATVIAARLDTAVTNGLLAPGIWNQSGFGALNQGDQLKTGYYVFQPPVSSLDAAERDVQRASVPFQIAVNLAGAIHSVNATIVVNT